MHINPEGVHSAVGMEPWRVPCLRRHACPSWVDTIMYVHGILTMPGWFNLVAERNAMHISYDRACRAGHGICMGFTDF